jgi:hypothetical protein
MSRSKSSLLLTCARFALSCSEYCPARPVQSCWTRPILLASSCPARHALSFCGLSCSARLVLSCSLTCPGIKSKFLHHCSTGARSKPDCRIRRILGLPLLVNISATLYRERMKQINAISRRLQDSLNCAMSINSRWFFGVEFSEIASKTASESIRR